MDPLLPMWILLADGRPIDPITFLALCAGVVVVAVGVWCRGRIWRPW